jgi:alkaline phosphatase
LATAKLALEELVGFDEAIQRAVDITDSSDTLIVVTADHSHTIAIGGYPSRGNPILGLYIYRVKQYDVSTLIGETLESTVSSDSKQSPFRYLVLCKAFLIGTPITLEHVG